MPLYQNNNSGIWTQDQTITLYTVISFNNRYLFNIKEDFFLFSQLGELYVGKSKL